MLGNGCDRNRTSGALEQGTKVAEKLPQVNTESFSFQQPRGGGRRTEQERAERGLREPVLTDHPGLLWRRAFREIAGELILRNMVQGFETLVPGQLHKNGNDKVDV